MLVVGIGASAGGMEALRRFLQAMPVDSGIAFVVIQHLDPDHQSHMAPLLSRYTQMQVCQVEEGMQLEADTVFFIPPNATMTLKGGVLHLRQPDEPRGLRLPIDAFFTSLAEDQGARAVGIVMSGSASDGSAGIRDIKAHGGLVIVQKPEDAEHDWMPRSAISTGMADLVLTVEEIPEALMAYRDAPYLAETEPALEPDQSEVLTAILSFLNARLGHDFRGYRKSTILRRIHRRMGFRRARTLTEYLGYLREDGAEAGALFQDLLIGVTKFFREPQGWEELKQRVVVPLVDRDDILPIRGWIPGCSTGKEAYTLAMLFLSAAEEHSRQIDLQLFATDIDSESLAYARAGEYPLEIADEVPAPYLERYFRRDDKGWRVVKELRQTVVFAPQNVISDPPFSKLDIISCRNLLIYLEPAVQEQLIRIFHFALRDGGYLFLGHSESVGPQRDLFEPLTKEWRIYQKSGRTRVDLLDIPMGFRGRLQSRALPDKSVAVVPTETSGLNRLAESIVLERYAPASVVIDSRDDVLYTLGQIEGILRHPRGAPTNSLLARLEEPLRKAARTVIAEVRSTGQRRSQEATTSSADGHKRLEIEVMPLRGVRRGDLLLVVFRPLRTAEVSVEVDNAQDQRVATLEEELQGSREEMQGIIEELESSNEELTASNEEIVSMNEELQSANEELETSKEELQSLNEELRTVNNELQEKVEQLEQTSNDLENLLRSTNIPTIFLDEKLRLKRFTPSATTLFNLLPSDAGRPISDLSFSMQDMRLMEDARAVLEHLQTVSHNISSEDGRTYIHRTQPYRTNDNAIQGVVMTFLDITDLEQAQAEVRAHREHLEELVAQRTRELSESEQNYRELVEQANSAIVRWDTDGHITYVNAYAETLFGYAPGELVGQDISVLLPTVDRGLMEALLKDPDRHELHEDESVTPDGRRLWVTWSDRVIEDPEGQPVGIMAVGIDSTRQHEAERNLRTNEERLRHLAAELVNAEQRERQRLVGTLHDEVAQPLGAIKLRLSLLESDHPEAAAEARQLIELTDEAVVHARAVMSDLSPPMLEKWGLSEALRWWAGIAQSRYDVQIDVQAPAERPALSPEVAVALFQATKELVHNAIKHAGVKEIAVVVRCSAGQFEVEVSDNGDGFDPAAVQTGIEGGFGLLNVRERMQYLGGEMLLRTAPGEGTQVTLRLPSRCEAADTGTPPDPETELG